MATLSSRRLPLPAVLLAGLALGGSVRGAKADQRLPPEFRTQIKKAVLLRDMINWRIENPLKGKPLAEGDPRLRALEAYILSARKGVPLEPGRH